MQLFKPVLPILMLLVSNIFMTFAWYGHLKDKSTAIWLAILCSWGIALFEYIFQSVGKYTIIITQMQDLSVFFVTMSGCFTNKPVPLQPVPDRRQAVLLDPHCGRTTPHGCAPS